MPNESSQFTTKFVGASIQRLQWDPDCSGWINVLGQRDDEIKLNLDELWLKQNVKHVNNGSEQIYASSLKVIYELDHNARINSFWVGGNKDARS